VQEVWFVTPIEIKVMFEELETPMQENATCRVGLLEKRRKPAATRRMRITDATKQKHLVVVVMAGIVARATGPNVQ